jgi:hypothetical protein
MLSLMIDELSAYVLIAGHHGSMISSRKTFLNAVSASTYVIASGPTKYGSITLPDGVSETEPGRGQLFTTYLDESGVPHESQENRIRCRQ